MKIIAEVTHSDHLGRARRYLVAVAPNGTVWERLMAGQGIKRRFWRIVH